MSKTVARVYSTLTNPVEYIDYNYDGDLPQRKYGVIIQGGSGLLKRAGLITPLGVATEIDAEQLDFLEQNVQFKKHVADGWLKVIRSIFSADADTVAADMSQRDGSAPLVPNDYTIEKLPTHGSNITAVKPPTKARRHTVRPVAATPFR